MSPRPRASTDEDTQKSPVQILDQEIESALQELCRPTRGLVFSGLSAGLDVGFSVLLMAVLWTQILGELAPGITHLIVANAYPIGFVFVILGRSELFTEHTTRAVLPVLSGQSSLRRLVRLWGIVYATNLVGAAIFAAMIVLIAVPLGVVRPEILERLATNLTDHPPWTITASAMLAGWLMGLLSWLVKAGQETISKIFVVWLVTSAIGYAGLHHCIVGSVEVLAGVFADGTVGLVDYGRFLLFSTLGNAIGGVVFVAVIKYAHATRQA